jgi:hypothetical protein
LQITRDVRSLAWIAYLEDIRVGGWTKQNLKETTMSYTVKYRNRFGLTKTIKNVLGFQYMENQDKMSFALEDGACEVSRWSKCEIRLGADWKKLVEETAKEQK